MKVLKTTTLVLTTLIAVYGCSSGSDSSGSGPTTAPTIGENGEVRISNPTPELAGSFKYFGYFDLKSDDLEDSVDYEANFLEMVETQPADVFANSVPPAVDSCNLSITPTILTEAGVIGFPEAQFQLVSAGDTLTLTSNEGTYADIDRSASRFDIAPYPIPEPLTLDIPGDVFPAITGAAVPDVIVVEGLSPSGNSSIVNKDTVFTWTPSGVDGNSVYISTFDFPQTGKVVGLTCRMADDGEFSLPADISSALQQSLGENFNLSGTRQFTWGFNVVVQGDTLLVLSKERQSL
ncbi:MAG: hypothetical protein AB8B87_02940 [Granulosicoccus sp.]